MKLLLNDQFSPITSTIGLLQTSLESAAAEYEAWMTAIGEEHGFSLKRRGEKGSFQAALSLLDPLVTHVRTKDLFCSTENGWTAFFDNGWQGSSANTIIPVFAERLGCRGVIFTAVPHTMTKQKEAEGGGRYGSTALQVFDPQGEYERTIFSTNDGGKWVFEESGERYDFENVEAYKARLKKDRFTPEMLADYLENLGIKGFKPDFYSPKGECNGVLFERQGNIPPQMQSYALHEVQSFF